MAFTPKDWRDADSSTGGGDESTPLNAVALEDLEIRLSDYTDSQFQQTPINVKDHGAIGDGATDDTAALQSAFDEAAWEAAGDPFCRTVYFPAGIYRVSSGFVFNTPIVLQGENSYGTRLQITDDFPADDYLLTYTIVGSPAELLLEENHIPGSGIRNLGFDGNGRTSVANVFDFDRVDRMQFSDVLVRNFKGTVMRGRNFRETQFWALRTWFCGDPTHPVIDFFDTGSPGEDGINLIDFTACQFALALGDFIRCGSASLLVVVREIWFRGCVFHGMPEYFDAYPDNVSSSVPMEDGQTKCRHIYENARSVFYQDCRFIWPARGMPIITLQPNATVGAFTINAVYMGSGNTFTFGRQEYPIRPLTDVNTTTNEMSVAGYPTNHNYMSTGSRVNISSGTPPAPLVLDTDYYVIVVSDTRFKLATTRANAVAGTAIDITTAGSSCTVSQFDSGITAVNTTANTLTLEDHALNTGARVWFASTGTLPAPLTDTPVPPDDASADYFAIRIDADTIKLATTRANADAGTAIDITTAGTGIHWLSPVCFYFDVEQGTLGVGSPNLFEWVPTRAVARVEKPLGAFSFNTDGSSLSSNDLPVAESSDGGGFQHLIRGAPIIKDNNTALYGYKADGLTAVQMAKVTAADVVVLGDAVADTQVFGGTVADLVVDLAGTPTVRVRASDTGLGFFGSTPVAKPTITGSRAGNAALASLLTAGANLGLWTDSTSA